MTLYIRETGGIMGSDLGTSTWVQSILEPAGLYLIELSSTDVVQEAKVFKQIRWPPN